MPRRLRLGSWLILLCWPVLAQALPLSQLYTPSSNLFSTFDASEWQFSSVDLNLLAALKDVDRRDYEAALVKVNESLANSPDSAAAHEILGVVLAKQGKLDDALSEFKRSAELAPNMSTPWTKMGDVYLAKEDSEKAKSCLLKAVALNPADYRAHQRLGLIFEDEGEVPLAIEHLEKGVVGPPEDYLGVKVDLGMLYNQTRQFGKTVSLLKNVVQSTTPNPAAHFALGTAYLGLKQTEAALQSFECARQFDSDPARAQLVLGIAERQAGNYHQSLQQLDAALKAKPDWWLPCYEQGETYLAQHQIPEALESLNTAARRSPHPVLCRNRIAEILTGEKKFDAAAQVYEKLREDGLADWKTYDGLATVYQLAGKLDEAKAVLQEGCRKLPIAPAFLRMGLFYGYIREYDQARTSLKKARSLSPADPRILKALSGVYLRTGDRTNAVALARELIAIVPNSAGDHVYLGALLEETQDLPAAAAEYEKALKLDPDQLLALNNLAIVQMKLGKLDEALRLANKAASKAPENAAFLDTRGWVLYANGDYQEASRVLKSAVRLADGDPTYHYHLAACYHKLGQRQEALDQCDKALGSATAFAEREEALALRESLK